MSLTRLRIPLLFILSPYSLKPSFYFTYSFLVSLNMVLISCCLPYFIWLVFSPFSQNCTWSSYFCPFPALVLHSLLFQLCLHLYFCVHFSSSCFHLSLSLHNLSPSFILHLMLYPSLFLCTRSASSPNLQFISTLSFLRFLLHISGLHLPSSFTSPSYCFSIFHTCTWFYHFSLTFLFALSFPSVPFLHLVLVLSYHFIFPSHISLGTCTPFYCLHLVTYIFTF